MLNFVFSSAVKLDGDPCFHAVRQPCVDLGWSHVDLGFTIYMCTAWKLGMPKNSGTPYIISWARFIYPTCIPQCYAVYELSSLLIWTYFFPLLSLAYSRYIGEGQTPYVCIFKVLQEIESVSLFTVKSVPWGGGRGVPKKEHIVFTWKMIKIMYDP